MPSIWASTPMCDNNQQPMGYEARSSYLASLLPGTQTGKVFSVFSSSLNLCFDGFLVHIGATGTALSSFGIRLSPERLKPLLHHCRADNLVRLQHGQLAVYTAEETILLDVLALPEMDLQLPEKTTTQEEIAHSALESILSAIPFSHHIGLPLDAEAMRHIECLVSGGTWPHGREAALAYLIGRGKGLTPSGDDLLLGYALVHKLLAPQNSWLDAWKKSDWSKTTAVSSAYQQALAKGYISEDWLALLNCLPSQSKEETTPLVARICATGHTSGYDMLFGFYLGILYFSSIKGN